MISGSRNLIKHGLPTESVTIAWRKRRQIETPNLLSPYVMESDSLSLRGWWMSHVRWDVAEMKQRSKRKPRQASSKEKFITVLKRKRSGPIVKVVKFIYNR